MEKTILTLDQVAQFQSLVYKFHTDNQRDFVWRNDITIYKILISEFILQQTQTARVVPKFKNWL